VNHSHRNALVDPSFTESINFRMSLFTVIHVIHQYFAYIDKMDHTCTLELQLLRGPTMLKSHDIRHRLTPAVRIPNYIEYTTMTIRHRVVSDLPGREMPMVVPFRSDISLNSESFPTITALCAEVGFSRCEHPLHHYHSPIQGCCNITSNEFVTC